MTDIFLGFIDFVSGTVSDLPTLEAELGVIGKLINAIQMLYDFITAANFLVPVPDIFKILSCIFILKTVKTLIWLGNWIIQRIFDVIP